MAFEVTRASRQVSCPAVHDVLTPQRADSFLIFAGLEVERPHIKPHVVTPAAADPPAQQRLRPLIYVYDLPAEFNGRMIQVGTPSAPQGQEEAAEAWQPHHPGLRVCPLRRAMLGHSCAPCGKRVHSLVLLGPASLQLALSVCDCVALWSCSTATTPGPASGGSSTCTTTRTRASRCTWWRRRSTR